MKHRNRNDGLHVCCNDTTRARSPRIGTFMTPIVPVEPSMTLVYHFLERSARLFPDKVALVHGPVRATYGRINSQANELARYLMSRGVSKGDRIPLLMENSLQYVVTYYAIMKAGGVAVPVNSAIRQEGLRYIIQDLGASMLISGARFKGCWKTHISAISGLFCLILQGAVPAGRLPGVSV